MAKDIHELAVQKGWWDVDADKSLPEILMLCVSELSEALEEHRNGRPNLYYPCNGSGDKARIQQKPPIQARR